MIHNHLVGVEPATGVGALSRPDELKRSVARNRRAWLPRGGGA